MTRFVSESDLDTNLANQTSMSAETLSQLRDYGVADDTELRLEFFFYTNLESNASELESSLAQRGYVVESGESASEDGTFVVTGWTTPVKMSETSLVKWIGDMCRTGFTHDCEFDGWGTNPNQ